MVLVDDQPVVEGQGEVVNDTGIVAVLLIFAVIVTTLTVAAGLAALFGWGVGRIVDTYTVKTPVTDQVAAMYQQQTDAHRDDDLLH